MTIPCEEISEWIDERLDKHISPDSLTEPPQWYVQNPCGTFRFFPKLDDNSISQTFQAKKTKKEKAKVAAQKAELARIEAEKAKYALGPYPLASPSRTMRLKNVNDPVPSQNPDGSGRARAAAPGSRHAGRKGSAGGRGARGAAPPVAGDRHHAGRHRGRVQRQAEG